MAEHLLNGTQVSAAFEQVRRKGVAQEVRLHRHRDTGTLGRLFYTEPEGLAGDRDAAGAQEERAAGLRAHELGSASLEIGLQGDQRSLADGHDAILGALTGHTHERGVGVDGLNF